MQRFPVHFDSDAQLREELEDYREILAQMSPELYHILDQCKSFACVSRPRV